MNGTLTVEQKEVGIEWGETSFTYDGKVHKPAVTIKNASGVNMKPEIQYTVSYSGNCKSKGTYTVTVTGVGYYEGTASKTFTIQ